jgi:hypothetical protein
MRDEIHDILWTGGEIGILMMFLPHLILANHLMKKGFLEGRLGENYLDISDVFDRFGNEKNGFFYLLALYQRFFLPLCKKQQEEV